jgi:hypothetical protein
VGNAASRRSALGPSETGALDDETAQSGIEWVRWIRPVEQTRTFLPADHKVGRGENFQFNLNGMLRKAGQSRQFPDMDLCSRVGEEQSQDLRPNPGKQRVQ